MLQCALIHTHEHSHTRTHTHTHTHTRAYMCTHTHHGQSVIHASTSMLCYCNLFYFLIVDPQTVFSCHPIHHMLLFCISIGAVPFSKLSCVSMCTFMHAHTYKHYLQLQSHVYCLCKFVFFCSGNYQQVFLLPFALLDIHECMHMHPHTHTHTHTHMHTNPHAHARTFMYTHTGVMLQSQTCAYVHIKMALAVIHHTHTHTCTHTYTELASAL